MTCGAKCRISVPATSGRRPAGGRAGLPEVAEGEASGEGVGGVERAGGRPGGPGLAADLRPDRGDVAGFRLPQPAAPPAEVGIPPLPTGDAPRAQGLPEVAVGGAFGEGVGGGDRAGGRPGDPRLPADLRPDRGGAADSISRSRRSVFRRPATPSRRSAGIAPGPPDVAEGEAFRERVGGRERAGGSHGDLGLAADLRHDFGEAAGFRLPQPRMSKSASRDSRPGALPESARGYRMSPRVKPPGKGTEKSRESRPFRRSVPARRSAASPRGRRGPRTPAAISPACRSRRPVTSGAAPFRGLLGGYQMSPRVKPSGKGSVGSSE